MRARVALAAARTSFCRFAPFMGMIRQVTIVASPGAVLAVHLPSFLGTDTMTRFFAGLTVCALAALLACNRGKGDAMNFRHNKDSKGTPVATFNDDSVTVEELKQRFSEMSPFLRARYQTVEQRKDYVDGLARFELLAAEAHRRGLQNDPEVVETAKKVMVQKLIQKEFDEKQGAVAEQEVKDYYESHKNDYVKPELVRISDIFFAAPKDDAALRKKQKGKADEVLTKAKAIAPTDTAAFATLVREN